MSASKLWYLALPALVGCTLAPASSSLSKGRSDPGAPPGQTVSNSSPRGQEANGPSQIFRLHTLGVVDLATTEVATVDLGVFVPAGIPETCHLASASTSLPAGATAIQYLAPSETDCSDSRVNTWYARVPPASASLVAYSLPTDPQAVPTVGSAGLLAQVVALGGEQFIKSNVTSGSTISETFIAPSDSTFQVICAPLIGFETMESQSPEAQDIDAATVSFTAQGPDGGPVEGLSSANVNLAEPGLSHFGQGLSAIASGSYALTFDYEPSTAMLPTFSLDLVDVPATGTLL